jgi:Stress responsive A/B Barrel Domain
MALTSRIKLSKLAKQHLDRYSTRMDHHVYFWLKSEGISPAERAEFEQGLAALFEIPLIKSGRWTVPAKVMVRPVVDQSWDYALTMVFANAEDHDAYQIDPDHLVFVDKFKELWTQVQIKDLA